MTESLRLGSVSDKEKDFTAARAAGEATKVKPVSYRASANRSIFKDEALRLVQQLFLSQAEDTPRVVVFAGVDHKSGCSQICAAVSETLAKTSRRAVCVVDANFRSSVLADLFETANQVGLADALLRDGAIQSFAEKVAAENLWLIPSGKVTKDSPGLLNSNRLIERVAELRREFEFVIIDAPPLTHYSDAIAVAQISDGLVLVLEADNTRRDAATAAAANVRALNIPILAAVLNKRSFPIPESIYKRL